MGLGNWLRRGPATAGRGPLGLDVNAGRARAAHGRAANNKLFALDDTHPDLPLAVAVERRVATVGRPALAVSRKLPHLVCTNYLPLLPHLGLPADGPGARLPVPPERALALAFNRLRIACFGHDYFGLALPPYLSGPQVSQVMAIAGTAGLQVWGSASVPLALAAERATHFLYGSGPEADARTRAEPMLDPTTVVVVDLDDHALTAAVVRITEEEVRTLATGVYPRLGLRAWQQRLVDAVSDRCIRQCRRDPRDSADADQSLFNQLDPALDAARAGQPAAFGIRSVNWYQDVVLLAAELDAVCAPLARAVADEVGMLVDGLNEPAPPRAAWLTHDAGRMPGLATALQQTMGEAASVRILHPEAAAAAVANLLDRWAAGQLPRSHLETAIPLPPRPDPRLTAPPRASVGHR